MTDEEAVDADQIARPRAVEVWLVERRSGAAAGLPRLEATPPRSSPLLAPLPALFGGPLGLFPTYR